MASSPAALSRRTDGAAAPAGHLPFTPRERALVARLRTPATVQRWLRSLPYNWEPERETLRSFRSSRASGRRTASRRRWRPRPSSSSTATHPCC